MRNNNGASIRKLSGRSLQNNRMRNVFAILAIALTGILFTAVFSMTGGLMQAVQEETMREVGGRFHAGLKAATAEQYEKISADPLVKGSYYTIPISIADNIIKHQAEIRYTPDESILYNMFIKLEEGGMPAAEKEIIVDTFVLDELGLPHALGEKIPLRFSFMGGTVEEEFTVCGWYRGDAIAHASELFVSESYWRKLKGSLTDEDFAAWKESHPENNGAGLTDGDLFFENASNLEEKIQTVIRNAGYEPGDQVAYGVNWAYMSSRMEALDPLTLAVLSTAVMVILVTGYLIIYNIFQISVVSDIRFYGLLKTIGTTKRQIRRLVRRQAFILSMIGIPVGLFIGLGIGKLAVPFMFSVSDMQDRDISLRFNPWILVFSVGFSALTVFISSRKPGKAAGSVSPIEAVRYTEAGSNRKAARRKKKNHDGRGRFSAVSMAVSNLGRSRRTSAVVITAISLSIILLAVIMTAVGSFRLDQFMEQRIVGDFVLGNINTTSSTPRGGEVDIAPEFLALADRQEGVESRTEMYVRFRSFLKADEEAIRRLGSLDAEGKLRREQYLVDDLEQTLRGEKSFDGIFYGYSEEILSNLKVLDGEFDMDQFRTGDYVLLTQLLGKEELPPEEHVYHPGDRVTIERYTEDSGFRDIKDASGMITDVVYENLAEKEYEVMAIVEIPYSMTLHRYSPNSCDVVLPLSEFEQTDECVSLFAASYRVAQEKQADFEAAVKAYTDRNANMGYMTKESLRKEFETMMTVIATIGITLAVVIALIGILNFVNAMITEMISRKREFAMLQSIGMTNDQLLKTLICEGLCYIVISGVVSFCLGSFLSWAILQALNNVILFFTYRFQILPFVIMLPALALVAVLVPALGYRSIRRKSIVERLRESE